jgi:TIGR03009 family protein
MPEIELSALMGHIRGLVGAGDTGNVTDRDLLGRFARRRDEPAFGALVRRHGPMVLATCRRVLRHEHDAEDTFQAVFLVLARKAGAIRWRRSVSAWLHEVAVRLARKAKAQAARRRDRESRPECARATELGDDITWRDLRPVLDEELHRLPEKYRAPLLLCCFEGKTRDEAARQLGWSLGAVKGRLERGRDLLRLRLTRRGIGLSAAMFGILLSSEGATAQVSSLLLLKTLKTATHGAASSVLPGIVPTSIFTLTEGASKTMCLTKLKMVLVLAVATAGLTAALVTYAVEAEPTEEPPPPSSKLSQPAKAATKAAPEPRTPLETVLARWEQATNSIRTFSAQVKRITSDSAFQTTEVYEGTLKYMKPNLRALHLIKKDNLESYEKYIFAGTRLYFYSPKEKKIRVVDLPKGGAAKSGKGDAMNLLDPSSWLGSLYAFCVSWWTEDSPFPFLLGTNAKEIQRRYNIKLLTAPANDHWYEYIMIEPKLATDRRHFMKARVVLSKSNYLVRQIWLLQPNHNEITWDFPRMVTGIALDRKEFAKPQLAEGWTFEETPLRAGDPKP